MKKLAERALAENNCAREPRRSRASAVGRERSVRQFQKEMGIAGAGSNSEITQLPNTRVVLVCAVLQKARL